MIDVTLKAPLKALNFNTYKSIYQENADYLALSNFQKGRADAGGLKCLFDNYLTFAPLGYTTLAIGRYMIETKILL
ncbi:MAG: hypothetical protein IPH33_01685 [Bacteroidetes bacterium]|nr:hypothetical protein [Bacteroidota bacterium]